MTEERQPDEVLMKRAREIAGGHYYCEDPWYSCPKAEDGCANPEDGEECNCRLEEKVLEIAAFAQSILAEARQQIADLESVLQRANADISRLREAAGIFGEVVNEQQIAAILRLEAGDDADEWFIPAEPGPLGPFPFPKVVQEFMNFIDREFAKADKRAETAEQQLAEARAQVGKIWPLSDTDTLRAFVLSLLPSRFDYPEEGYETGHNAARNEICANLDKALGGKP